MADEGIMALPQGTGMQGEQPPVQQAVTSADSYDAAQTALGRVNPGGQAALKEALRQNIGNLQLTPQQLDALIQVFEYVSQHPGDYKNLLQKMLEAGVLDEGDMPPEYDPEFIGAMLAVLNEMQQMQAAGAQEPMDLSPVVQGLQPMGMASGGLADIGQYLASKGRGGDSMLAHINPEEAAMLKRRGGSGTINPNTGLPEFKEGALGGVFDAIGGALKGVANVAKDLLKSPVGRILGTIALATVLGPAGVGLSMGVAGGLAGAGTSLLAGGSVKEALVSGAMGYIGGGGTVMGVNPVEAVGSYLPGAAGGALNTGLATGVIGAGIGKLGGMSTEDALQMGLVSGASAGLTRGFGGMSPDDYAVKSKMLTLAEAGDTNALALHDSGNVGNMKAYLANAENQLFKGVPPATDAQMAKLGQRYSPATDAQMANLTSAGGNAGPGLKVPPVGSSMAYNPATANFDTNYSLYNAPASDLRMPTYPTTSVPGMGTDVGAGVRFSPEFTNADLARGVGGTGGGTNYGFRPVPPTSTTAAPTGFFNKMVTGAENIYDTYLSPDRAGLPSDVSFFRKYGPLAAAGTATIAAFGGMDSSPAEIDPITAGERARYAESRLRAKARRDRMANYGLEGNRPLIYAANGGIMTANKVRHLYEGGDAAGYGYGEGEGAAQGAGMGGYGSSGEGYASGYELTPTLINQSNIANQSNRKSSLPAYDSVMLAQSLEPMRPAMVGHTSGIITGMQDADNNVSRNVYGYQDVQQAKDAYESLVAEQGMRNNIDNNTFSEGADGRAKGGYIGRFNNGGYIQRFVAGSDADGVLSNDERRRLAQERRRGYGLEGNLLDTALAQARTGNAARPFDEYFVNNSGDQRGPGITNTGGIPGLNIDPVALALAAAARPFLGSAVSLGPRAPVTDATFNPVGSGSDTTTFDGRTAGGDFGGDAYGGSYNFAKGGPAKMTNFPRRDGPINGPGTGTSDDIPAMLSDGEFVFTAKAVRNAGGGSRRKGAARMYKLMKKLEGGAVKGN